MKKIKSKIRCGGMLAILVLAVGLIAEVAKADFTFGTPTNLGPTVNSVYQEWDPAISANGLLLFFNSPRPGGFGGDDIWVATRITKEDEWDTPENLGPSINTAHEDFGQWISADGLELYFSSDRPGGSGDADLYVTKRATIDEPWQEPVNLGPTVNSLAHDINPTISADGLWLFFSDRRISPFRSGGYGSGDIWVTRRMTKDDDWLEPVNLGGVVNTSTYESSPSISADGRTLFFASNRPGGVGRMDLWITRRASTSRPWEPPVWLGPTINSSYLEAHPCISADGLTLYLTSDRSGSIGNTDLWQVPIIPLVDFNGDGIVDSADMCIMVDYWHTNEPSCDIGPMPWGDGIINVQDLIVLAEHLFTYPGAVAYWKLDETEGDIAYDSVGIYDGILNGVPTWQPTSGMIDGALELDGIDDYVSTEFVLNPADGPFSVFAWIKGGAAGQVVIAQKDGVNWLLADPSEGYLMTELRYMGPGRVEELPLLSQTLITDGKWHRVGFVWDGSHRTLYVDDIAVAEDAQDNLEGSDNGLYIGTGKAMEPGSFWSGLIDDVRIYGRAISP